MPGVRREILPSENDGARARLRSVFAVEQEVTAVNEDGV